MLSYDVFKMAIVAIEEQWKLMPSDDPQSPLYRGWTASAWAEELLSGVSEAIWNSATDENRELVWNLLQRKRHQPELFSGTFVSLSPKILL